MGSVVVLGSVSQDLHLHMPRHPHTGETLMAGDIERRFGGKGANQGVAAAQTGARSAIVGTVGDDEPGHAYVQRLRRFGVDTSRLEIVPDAPTGTAIIYVDNDGDNMIVVAPGANHQMGASAIDRLRGIGPGDVLLMPLELPLDVVQEAIRFAAARGARVVLNLAPFGELPNVLLALCDPVVVNEHEAQLLAESGLEVPSLLVTLGAEGSQWGALRVAATPVHPVDTTGAGDAYCGTLAARLCLGDTRELAMAAASEAAAACVAHPGAQPGPSESTSR